ncbi:MAG TPA: D-alanine--D-alanine ligase family protein [Candidatus Nanopelagicaceae bacterium]|nr:D-alanine--D-alanine ligase family protein [Candidatus Nanopelagicaceae bacterium]
MAPRVGLLFGGRSSEHGISCLSAASVLSVIDRDKYDVVAIGISREGRWVMANDDPIHYALESGDLPSIDGGGMEVVLAGDPTQNLMITEPGQIPRAIGNLDVLFPLLHGPYGEDGTIQGLCELAGIAYVGSGVLASAAAMDKPVMKALFAQSGLVNTPYLVVTDAQWRHDPAKVTERVSAELGFPVFVKPARAGSSKGISKVTSSSALVAAITEAQRHDPRLIIEKAVSGREIECGVLETLAGGAETTLPAEIRVIGDHEFYDFQAKYLDDATVLDVPADLPEPIQAEIRRQTLVAFNALGCEGLARVDFFLDDNQQVVINEINTMPGFTPTSMYPRMWAASGVDYSTLVDRLIQLALHRRRSVLR